MIDSKLRMQKYEKTKSAVVREIEVIGEAAKNIQINARKI